MDALLTGPEAAALCGVDPATIRSWKRRGLLEPAGLDDRGRPLYRQLAVAQTEARTRERAGRSLPEC
ncbi:DNA-binding transcriptional MerR regulator [Kitasatospora sp. MAP12-15]|uniref:MerR family transcriptional regulator n=1 Tax=unclassified Kitasatospora TaxID=2633591 RepID=UPI002473C3E2|nr:MerR family DNA-binding transcriptional regulator [Kitasatospora sp. MAP12-44]MDH6111934.1 DNA-binding transcriptional MerR regulator [Kitasatospora sp. MAP12-44]